LPKSVCKSEFRLIISVNRLSSSASGRIQTKRRNDQPIFPEVFPGSLKKTYFHATHNTSIASSLSARVIRSKGSLMDISDFSHFYPVIICHTFATWRILLFQVPEPEAEQGERESAHVVDGDIYYRPQRQISPDGVDGF
jgi:hypothetical protein